MQNPEECQQWCQETKECEFFVYKTKAFSVKAQQNYCYLKKNMADKLTTRKGLIGGPKFCQINEDGMFITFLLFLSFMKLYRHGISQPPHLV